MTTRTGRNFQSILTVKKRLLFDTTHTAPQVVYISFHRTTTTSIAAPRTSPFGCPRTPKNRRSSSSQPISHFIILFVEKTLTQAAQIRSQIKNKRTKTYEKRQAQNGDLFIL